MTATKAAARKTAAKKVAAVRAARDGHKPGPDAAAVEKLIEAANVDTSAFPVMVGMHQVSRRRKAQMMAAAQTIPDTSDLDTLIRAAADNDLAAATRVMEIMADVEDILATFALDEEAFRMWAQIADEASLIALMGTVMTEAGEASSSSS